jgi:hypothetical protein
VKARTGSGKEERPESPLGPLGSRPEPVIGALSSGHSGLPRSSVPSNPPGFRPCGRRPSLRPTGEPVCPQPSDRAPATRFPGAFAPPDRAGLRRGPKPSGSRGRSGRTLPALVPAVDRNRLPTRIDLLRKAVPGPDDPPSTPSTRRSPLSPFVPPKRNSGSFEGPSLDGPPADRRRFAAWDEAKHT